MRPFRHLTPAGWALLALLALGLAVGVALALSPLWS